MLNRIYETMRRESLRIDDEIIAIADKLKTMPVEDIICINSKRQKKWFLNTTDGKRYISKKQRKYAESLVEAKYLRLKLKNLENEKKALRYYFKHCKKNQLDKLFDENKAYFELLKESMKPEDIQARKWVEEEYERNERYPENLRFKTYSGYKVRSKSELLIDTALFLRKIPFRYECKLELKEETFYPDFMIYDYVQNKVTYWEHFGMMDDPYYNKTAIQKLKIYIDNGIIPGINLIITTETKDNPLTSEFIERTIDFYFGQILRA